jgi:hypothetical protein
MSDLNVNLHPKAHALRPARLFKNGNLVHYEGTTFPKNPWSGCELYLRRCKSFGYLKDAGDNILVDVLDENGDIVQDFPITRTGFKYLRRQLKFKRERD